MRITQVITSLGYGGAEREVARLAKKLREQGEDCEVVCVCEEGHLAADLRAIGVPVKVLDCGLMGLAKLTGYLRSSRPDVVHGHLVSWAPIAGKLAHVPAVIVTEHGLSLWRNHWQISFDRFVARFADRIVVVAGAVMEVRLKRWRIPAQKLVLIPNGVEQVRFDIEVEPAVVKTELGVDPADALVVTVGHLTAVKGHRYLLRAAAEVLKQMPGVSFVLVGDGPLRQELQSTAEALGIHERVKFLGYRKDVERILKAADVFALSSLREGTSIAILEAMAAGTPVVATAVGGNPEVIQNGRSGLLVPAENPNSLAEAIVRVLTNPELASSLVKEARERVESEYSAEGNLARLKNLYREVLKGAG